MFSFGNRRPRNEEVLYYKDKPRLPTYFKGALVGLFLIGLMVLFANTAQTTDSKNGTKVENPTGPTIEDLIAENRELKTQLDRLRDSIKQAPEGGWGVKKRPETDGLDVRAENSKTDYEAKQKQDVRDRLRRENFIEKLRKGEPPPAKGEEPEERQTDHQEAQVTLLEPDVELPEPDFAAQLPQPPQQQPAQQPEQAEHTPKKDVAAASKPSLIGRLVDIQNPNDQQKEVIEAFKWAWDGYKKFAWGHDHLKPVSKSYDDWFGLGLTLIDGLDTAYIMGLKDIYQEARDWVASSLNMGKNVDVNLFETTIRILGAFLSCYHLTGDDLYLDKARELGNRLMPAFQTGSGIPLSDVNIGHGTAHGPAWSPWSSVSEVTSIQLEFKYLSAITGDKKYVNAADKVIDVMQKNKPQDGLVSQFIDPQSGHLNGGRVTLGARGDSYYEYLLKQWLQTQKKENKYKTMFQEAMNSVQTKLVKKTHPNQFWFVGELEGHLIPKMDHLVCWLPGTLAIGAQNGLGGGIDGDYMKLAIELMKTCYETYARTPSGLAPEITYYVTENDRQGEDMYIKQNDEHNLLRPETVESLFVLHRITKNPIYREWGWKIFKSFEKYSKISTGGYSNLHSVVRAGHITIPPGKFLDQIDSSVFQDKMESFFLGETLKYFYLLFDDSGMLSLDEYVFNTEAHPLPVIPPL